MSGHAAVFVTFVRTIVFDNATDRPAFPYRPVGAGFLPWVNLKTYPEKSEETLSQSLAEFEGDGGAAGFDSLVKLVRHLNAIPDLMSTHCESAWMRTAKQFTDELCENAVTDVIVIQLSNAKVTATPEDRAAQLANDLFARNGIKDCDSVDFSAVVEVGPIQMLIDGQIGYGVRIRIEGFGEDRPTAINSWTKAVRGACLVLHVD